MVVSSQTNHQKRAVGVLIDRQSAEQSLKELKSSGFSMDKISVIAKDHEQLSGTETSDRIGDQNVNTATGAVADTFAHASWGTVLVGLTSLALPGIGPILAAGSLGAALIATTAGTGISAVATGALVDALKGLGIPQGQAESYGDHLHQGHYLVFVEGTDDEIQRAEEVFNRQGIQGWGVYTASPA